MKKSIVYLSIALVSFSAISNASTVRPVVYGTVNHSQYELSTPLCVAIYKGEIALVQKLIEYGADVNEKSSGLTPLMMAARFNRVEIIKLLLANGAKLKQKDDNGIDALKYAQLSNASDAVVYLKLAMTNPVAQR
ncbi:ankyrin repeat domain-containing protein [Flavobacterium restrictum]|uniref:Ankyrin repeat domain-containing protein n=1 Tax=Flavobacterium restrictum TaxID=2594428 RepID=A0A553E785_9FLAO|nr:ankyrin repeat domain-containing protein [Flavobacterium restrictum]TRX40908.1 ankyrin repeat domain-containing protein [Flavobacterium restrictum]